MIVAIQELELKENVCGRVEISVLLEIVNLHQSNLIKIFFVPIISQIVLQMDLDVFLKLLVI